MAATAALTSLGALLYSLTFVTTAPLPTKEGTSQAGKRKQLTQLGKRMQAVLDPLMAPLAEQHWNIAVTLLTVLFSLLMFLAGALFSVVYPGGNPGVYLQKPYDLMKAMPFSNKPYFMFLAAGVADFLVIAFYLPLDYWRPPFVQKMIQQKRRSGDWDHGLMRTIKQSFQCFIFSALCLVYQEIRSGPSLYTTPWMPTCFDSCKIELPDLAPSLTEFVAHFALCLVTFDFSYWYVHWQMHRHRKLYKMIHSIHHEYREPFVTVGSHVHPVEFNLVFILATVAPIACGAHPFTAVVFQMVQATMGMEDHTGWSETAIGWVMDKVTLGNFPGSKGHNTHHAVISGNYEPYLGYLDRLCGLDVELDTEEELKVPAKTAPAPKEPATTSEISPGAPSELRKRSRTATPPPTPRA